MRVCKEKKNYENKIIKKTRSSFPKKKGGLGGTPRSDSGRMGGSSSLLRATEMTLYSK